MIKIFDLKLVDGSYFKDVDIIDSIEQITEIEYVLSSCDELEIYSYLDDDCENLLAKIKSDDIEYIAKAYKYKEN